MQSRKILGVAASLRNARWGAGNEGLIDQLAAIETKDELVAYLVRESQLHLENFLEAGRREGKNFLEIYDNLQKKRGDSGLSNSEVALAASLWAAHREGVAVDYLSLSEHFTASGRLHRPEKLRAKLLGADGLLVSGPVYFGDRGSLAESLIEFIARDAELKAALRGRLYGGIAVGAKRNGGQETTLIYQMLDMANLGMLAVGNDSDTTAQYGGTCYAGDVGTMGKDKEGLETSMGTGLRMARVLKQFGTPATLQDVPKTLFLILQDSDGIAARMVDGLCARFRHRLRSEVVNLTGQRIKRCIACDICPTHVGHDEEYRCIITSAADGLPDLHEDLLHHDLIVPVGVSMNAPIAGSKYQAFVERTRYLRRADYIWSDVMVAPLVLEEPGDCRSLPIRMMTSFLRHHTVMAKPLVGYLDGGDVADRQRLEEDFAHVLDQAARMAAGRLALAREGSAARRYNPIGYVLAADKDREDERLQRRCEPSQARRDRLLSEASRRLAAPTT